ncbi:hypothetical protein DVT68_17205 [Dyella solisilvae]|uniref:Silver efflux pump n=1 Tax=Dyella solisilvae TaxID=1920168 RepID=A0A370K4A7_9GAMM|nr:hypothetical protein [Dyella solisilvae]RDI97479.1 hypothetical protein DVT68_17205 [Dyella solisilvae]
MKTSKLNGAAMAMMVAGLFAATSMTATAGDKTASDSATASVKCVNSSSCKGQGSCKQATNACKGQNSCKGQGFTMQKTQQDCEKAQAAAKTS